ncbi:MAG: hypothetical protein NTX79_08855 [Candidatus Micrarchaeota archaeon]|nr:hypothetical protein [Candidatus Micrarchaeota archaeon]
MANGDGKGGKMGGMPGLDFDYTEDLQKAVKGGDVSLWFSDPLFVKYTQAFPARYREAESDIEREDIYREAKQVLALYSICTYYIYPNSPAFREKIASNKEFGKNFGRMKKWLDGNEGKKIADEFVENIVQMGKTN